MITNIKMKHNIIYREHDWKLQRSQSNVHFKTDLKNSLSINNGRQQQHQTKWRYEIWGKEKLMTRRRTCCAKTSFVLRNKTSSSWRVLSVDTMEAHSRRKCSNSCWCLDSSMFVLVRRAAAMDVFSFVSRIIERVSSTFAGSKSFPLFLLKYRNLKLMGSTKV